MSNVLRLIHGEFGRVALLDMDGSLVRHAHPHCHVLIKVSGADTRFAVRDKVAVLTDESAVLINAWETHAYVHGPVHERTIILALYVEPRWLSCFRANWGASGAPGFFTSHVGALSPRIRQVADELGRLMLAEPGAGPQQTELVAELMVGVIERFTDWRGVGGTEWRMDWRVRRAIASIRRDPAAVTSLTGLARQSGLSRAHFFRLFEQAAGMPPRVFINMLRVETAVADIMDGTRSMTEISDNLGFSVPAHFTRFFRDHAGAAPREFRSIARLQAAA